MTKNLPHLYDVTHKKNPNQNFFIVVLKICQVFWQFEQLSTIISRKSLKWMWSQMNVVTNVCGHKYMWSQIYVVTNICGHKCTWSQMYVVTNVRGLKCMWFQMNVVWNECGLKWTWSEMNVVSNEVVTKNGLKWIWSQLSAHWFKHFYSSSCSCDSPIYCTMCFRCPTGLTKQKELWIKWRLVHRILSTSVLNSILLNLIYYKKNLLGRLGS